MIFKALFSILPNIVGRIADGFKHRREVKNAVAVKQLEFVRDKAMVDSDWEMEAIRASKESWKDELWTLVFVYLLLSAMWAPAQMKAVFLAYAGAPYWFQLCVLVSVGSSFGVKIWKLLK